ncbi:MAG: thioredoxin [Chloroflexota bacterium]
MEPNRIQNATPEDVSSSDGKIYTVTDDNFIQEVLEAGSPVLVDFWAPWCGPCKFMGPIFSEVAPEYQGKVKFAKLDVDQNPGVSQALHIESIPTFMLISGRTVYAQGAGAMRPDDLRRWIDQGLEHMQSARVEAAV